MNKRLQKMTLFAVIVAMLCLTACGSGKEAAFESAQVMSNRAYDAAYSESYAEPASADYAYKDGSNYIINDGGTNGTTDVTVQDTSRKLIKTVYLECETENDDVSVAVAPIVGRVSGLGGYIESMNKNKGYCTMIIRIPSDKLDDFVEAVEGDTNVVSRTESARDVTMDYVDMDAHKRMLEVEYERLLSFLEKAEDMADIITIESRLTDIRYQIESMESQLRTYDNLVDYATVSVSVTKVSKYTPPAERTFFQRIGDRISDNTVDVVDNLGDFVVWFTGALPHLIIWAIVITGIVLLIKRWAKKSRKKRERKAAEKAMQQAQQPVIMAQPIAPQNPQNPQ